MANSTEPRGTGRVLLASVFLTIGGFLSIFYGIAAISNSHFFTANGNYVFGDLKAWGWITLILGLFELGAALSLATGNVYGRWFAIIAASLAAVGALLDLPAYPLWSIAIFALSLWILHGLLMYGETVTAS
jgi:hypothetical protein